MHNKKIVENWATFENKQGLLYDYKPIVYSNNYIESNVVF